MKRVLALLTCAVLCLAFLAACGGNGGGGNNDDICTHTYSESWTITETHHWFAATCKHVDEKLAYGEHEDKAVVDGKCDWCGYEENSHVHTFSDDWSSDTGNHWHAATCEHTEEVKDVAAHYDANRDGVCDACEYELDHEHTFAEEWSSDEDNHWYAATCAHTTETKDKAPHVDGNTDGKCDECEHHVHTYSSAWTYDETDHWHKAACEHDTLISDKAAHADEDEDGFCDVCGSLVSIIKLVATLGENASVISDGSVSYIRDEFNNTYSYKFGADGHFYRTDLDGWERWYKVYSDRLIALAKNGADAGITKPYENETERVNGIEFVVGSESFFGLEALLYVLANETEDVYEVAYTDGVYTFSASSNFGSLVEYTVSFSVDATSDGVLYLKSLSVLGAEDYHNFKYEATQNAATKIAEATLDIDSYLATEYEFAYEDGAVVDNGSTITLQIGETESVKLYLKDFVPATANLSIDYITYLVDGSAELNANLSVDTEGLDADEPYIEIKLGLWDVQPALYELTVNSTKVTHTFTVDVKGEPITEIVPGIFDYYISRIVSAASSNLVYVGNPVKFAGLPNGKHTGKYTAELISAPDGSEATVAKDKYNAYIIPDVAGTYVIKLTSTDDETVTSELTLNAVAPITMDELLVGTHFGASFSLIFGNHGVGVTFAEDNKVTITRYSVEHDANGDIQITDVISTDTYTYSVEGGNIVLYNALGEVDDTYKIDLTFDPEFNNVFTEEADDKLIYQLYDLRVTFYIITQDRSGVDVETEMTVELHDNGAKEIKNGYKTLKMFVPAYFEAGKYESVSGAGSYRVVIDGIPSADVWLQVNDGSWTKVEVNGSTHTFEFTLEDDESFDFRLYSWDNKAEERVVYATVYKLS